MLRFAVFALFIATATSQTDSPIVEFLRNFNNPVFGNTVNRMINNIQTGTESPQREIPYESDEPIRSYVFSRWSDFGQCTKICGGGSQKRTRTCVDETGTPHPLAKCFTSMPHIDWDMFTLLKARKQMEESDERLCNTHECQTTEWQYPTECSHKCGEGMMTYTRVCLNAKDQDLCNTDKKKMVPCNTDPCFRVGEWRRWSRCTRECGGGQSSRSRSCMPNVPPYSPLYSELQYALQHVSEKGVSRSLKDPKQLYYLDQYIKSCGAKTVQTRLCNHESCPSCPQNQKFYHCKPCMRFCKRVDLTNIAELNLELPNFDRSVTGCGGQCEPGCGCPFLEPLTGYDQRCYSMDLLCPQNKLSPSMQSFMFLQLMLSKLEEERAASAQRALSTKKPTTKKPRKPGRRKLPKSTPEPTDAPASTYAPDPEYETPNPAGHEYPASNKTENVAKPYKPTCPFDMSIMDPNICECRDGVMNEVSCLTTSPEDKCPLVCKAKGSCPNPNTPRGKNAYECDTTECQSDENCTGDFKCCNLSCGRRCVYPVM